MIKPVEGRTGEYLVYRRSHFLDAMFSVYFKDTLMDVLALLEFTEMIRRRYEEQQVRKLVSGEGVLGSNNKNLPTNDPSVRRHKKKCSSSFLFHCQVNVDSFYPHSHLTDSPSMANPPGFSPWGKGPWMAPSPRAAPPESKPHTIG